MRQKRIHPARFRAEAGHAVATLLGGAEFDFKNGRVARVDDAEVVGHGAAAAGRFGGSGGLEVGRCCGFDIYHIRACWVQTKEFQIWT